MQNDLLIRSLKREKCERTPIWIMRQAGRYLPEYRAVRQKTDFLTLCKTPELAAEVTIQPVDIIGVDAAIIFSDILVVPEAMGMELELIESIGPRFHHPIRTAQQIEKLALPDVTTELQYVEKAIAKTAEALAGRVPIIGFSGAPWTLMAYMVEGAGKTNFTNAKQMLYSEPKQAHALLQKLTTVITDYLAMQAKAGANAVQVFDTWAGLLSPDHYKTFSLTYIKKIVTDFKAQFPKIPIIVFAKGTSESLWGDIVNTGCDAVGLDWVASLKKAKAEMGSKVCLQGNLDPLALYASDEALKAAAQTVLSNYGDVAVGTGHVFNLGHGILPDVSVEKVKLLVETIKSESAKKHL